MSSADFCHAIGNSLEQPSADFDTTQQISWGKFNHLPRASAEFTTMTLDGYGLCAHLHARPIMIASYSVSVRQIAILLPASSRPNLAVTPLRFTNTSLPSNCVEDFHLRVVEHAQRTRKTGALTVSAGLRFT